MTLAPAPGDAGRTRAARARLAALLAASVACSCGAKTGLRGADPDRDATIALDASELDASEPDATEPDATEPDASDATLTCVEGSFLLQRREAEVLFVLDRSGSMNDDLEARRQPPRRWDVLRDALATTLPGFQRELSLGAYAYPRRFDGDMTRSCQVTRQVDAAPRSDNAAGVLGVLEGSDPWGATPTADALRFAGEYMAARVSLARSATLVLATDGGPNCNPALDPTRCDCTGTDTMGRPNCFDRGSSCLDHVRAGDVLRDLRNRGVPTYVIGLDSTTRPVERMALAHMAREGGRPNPGAVPYYSAREPAALRAAFEQIQSSIVRCTLVSPSRPDAPDAIRVRLEGREIPRDASHMDGWDWTAQDFGQISFFGAACDRVRATTAAPVVTVGCRGG